MKKNFQGSHYQLQPPIGSGGHVYLNVTELESLRLKKGHYTINFKFKHVSKSLFLGENGGFASEASALLKITFAKNPVLFIPGIGGSVLKCDVNGTPLTNYQVWPSVFPWDVRWLNLRANHIRNVRPTDVVRRVQLLTPQELAAVLELAGGAILGINPGTLLSEFVKLYETGVPAAQFYGNLLEDIDPAPPKQTSLSGSSVADSTHRTT